MIGATAAGYGLARMDDRMAEHEQAVRPPLVTPTRQTSQQQQDLIAQGLTGAPVIRAQTGGTTQARGTTVGRTAQLSVAPEEARQMAIGETATPLITPQRQVTPNAPLIQPTQRQTQQQPVQQPIQQTGLIPQQTVQQTQAMPQEEIHSLERWPTGMTTWNEQAGGNEQIGNDVFGLLDGWQAQMDALMREF